MKNEVSIGLDVGRGWRAISAEVPERPSAIVLVTFGRNGEKSYARLDLGKHILIDSLPAKPAREVLEKIAQRIGRASRHRSTGR